MHVWVSVWNLFGIIIWAIPNLLTVVGCYSTLPKMVAAAALKLFRALPLFFSPPLNVFFPKFLYDFCIGNNRLFLKQPSLSCFFSFLTPFSHGTLYFLLLIYPSSSSWARTWHAMAGCSQPHRKTGHHPHHSSCQSKTWILHDLYYRQQNDWSIHVKNISIRRES